jgi:hypothetical protein
VDVHKQTAAVIFDGPVDRVTPAMRSQAKTVNFATLYGQGAFSLARPRAVDLRVFGVDGREVADLSGGVWSAGSHEVAWSGRDSRGALTASGVYLVRFATEGRVETRRVVRLR